MSNSYTTDVPFEQICYITCNFCNIILAVSVPCSSLFDMVTVRCGHCTNLLSVNMAAALQSLSWQNLQTQNFLGPDYRVDLPSSSSRNNNMNEHHNHHQISTPPPSTNSKSEGRIVNRPPEKKQRVPSAYNQFIKEEIQRIKANNPDITHREAFSTAAKSWAHYPHHNNHSAAAAGSALETNLQVNKVQEEQKNEE